MAGLSSAVPLDSKFVTPWCVCGRTCRRLLLLTRNAHMLTRARFGLFPFRSPLLRESFLFLEVLRCFSSPRALRHTYVFSMRYPGIPLGGFPHSDISGSTLVGNSPELFAACCVLHRPLAPRHPPCALSSLIYASSLQDFCSHSVQFLRCLLPHSSGDEGARTPDLLRAREALSHLSYIPLWAFLDSNQRPFPYQRNALAD